MGIYKKLVSVFFREKKKSLSLDQVQHVSMREREYQVYDVEQLTLQKLYEKWLSKDKWLLHKEAIPLLFGLNPDINRSDEYETDKVDELWTHAKDCVQKKLLRVVNSEQEDSDWEVFPVDFYRWATVSRITVPAEFSTLMAFVMQVVKPEHESFDRRVEDLQDSNYQKHKEIVLGAAISLLVNAPEQCKNNDEFVIDNIARLIIENKKEWFGEDNLLLEKSEMITLINDYINLTKPVL